MGALIIGPELAIADAFLAQTFDANRRSAGKVTAIDGIDLKYHRTP